MGTMPQYIVVRCYNCKVFRSMQKTKKNKWNCIMCHEKQSVLKVYALTTKSKDLRPVVQQLNMTYGKMEENKSAQPEVHSEAEERYTPAPSKSTKWKQFDQPSDVEDATDEDAPAGDAAEHYCLQAP